QPRFRIKSNQPAIKSSKENAPVHSVPTFPIGNASMLIVAPRLSALSLRIELPDLSPGLGVERNDAIRWRRKIKNAVHDQRRRFERSNVVPISSVSASVHFSGVVRPHAFQTIHVFSADLSQCRKSRPTRIAAVVSPFLGVRRPNA